MPTRVFRAMVPVAGTMRTHKEGGIEKMHMKKNANGKRAAQSTRGLLAIAMMASMGFSQASEPSASAPTVVLDTGHMPSNPGSKSAYGRNEYDFNRRLAYLVALHMAERGIAVERVEGEYPLTSRTLTTQGKRLFVSIHHDSIPQAWINEGKRGSYSGFSVFVSRKNPLFSQSLWCAQNIGWKLAQAGEHPSLYHATPMKGENRPILDKSAGVHLYDDLIVLKTARSPAVLVEAGVIANPSEDLRLGDARVADGLARAIAGGVTACLAKTGEVVP